MKIAVLIRKFRRNSGGAERYCVELTERLAINHEVHVFAQEYEDNCQLIKFHKISRFFEKPRFINQLLFSWLTKKATFNKFDIIHSHELVSHADIYTIHLPCFRSILINLHGFKKKFRYLNTFLSPRKIMYLWLENQQMKQVKKCQFISVSEFLSRNIYQCYPSIKNITIAYPGLSENFVQKKIENLRNNLAIPEDSFLILLVANNLKKKGFSTIVKSLEILKNYKLHLIVAGNDKKAKEKISTSIASNIHFLGLVQDMHSLYSEVDLLVHPTLADTYGMAPLEAMSMRIPVIISNMKFCGFSEHLNNSQALILKNPRNENELSAGINFLYQNLEKRMEIAHNGYELTKEISWENTLNKTLEAYKLLT